MVICGDFDVSPQNKHAVTIPIVIIEVLSKTTESYDRGKKFSYYRQIPSLQEYILIEQEEARIEVFTRRNDFWKITTIEGIDGELFIPALDITIPLDQIYQGVQFLDSGK